MKPLGCAMQESMMSSKTTGSVAFFRRMLEERLEKLAQLLSGLDAKSPRRHIHDLRVLSRRLRAAFSVLACIEMDEPAGLFRKKLRAITQNLGPVRSCDVSHKIFKRCLPPALKEAAQPLRFIEEFLEARRKELRRELLRDLKKAGAFKLAREKMRREALGALEGLSAPFLAKALERKARKVSLNVLKSWRHFCHKTTLARLHEVRIDLKKWRYLLELQHQCLGSTLADKLEPIKGLLKQMGDLHDLEVLLEELGGRPCAKAASACGQKKAWTSFLALLESEIEKRTIEFYNEGQHKLSKLLPLRSL